MADRFGPLYEIAVYRPQCAVLPGLAHWRYPGRRFKSEGTDTLRSGRLRRILLLAASPVLATSLFGQTAGTSDKSEGVADPMKPLSVCEVLERRAELMGRFETVEGESKTVPMRELVSVRGEVKSGPHGSYLIAAPTCTFKLRITGTTWPSGLTTPGATYPNIIWLGILLTRLAMSLYMHRSKQNGFP